MGGCAWGSGGGAPSPGGQWGSGGEAFSRRRLGAKPSDQIWLFIFRHFSKFLLICDLTFDKLALPSWIYVLKDALNHFLVHSSAKNNLRRARNVLFFLFCILVDRPPPSWLRYCQHFKFLSWIFYKFYQNLPTYFYQNPTIISDLFRAILIKILIKILQNYCIYIKHGQLTNIQKLHGRLGT